MIRIILSNVSCSKRIPMYKSVNCDAYDKKINQLLINRDRVLNRDRLLNRKRY